MLHLKNISLLFISESSQIEVIKDFSMLFPTGSLTVITGKNGSGKSTLAQYIMGVLPDVTAAGEILLRGVSITAMPVEQRARAGIFLAYQQPCEIPGVSVVNFLQHAYRSIHSDNVSIDELRKRIGQSLIDVGLPISYLDRSVNEGFSGGEKKRLELAQMLVLQPQVALLDELDSGLDQQGVLMIVDQLKRYRRMHPHAVIIYITHNTVLMDALKPDQLLILSSGVLSGVVS